MTVTNNYYLFDRENMTKLSTWNEINAKLSARNLLARPLKQNDYENGYLELLSQLTEVGEITKSKFEDTFRRMKNLNQADGQDHYVIVIIEDITTNKVVGASTLFLEQKFIHQCAIRGRLEDVAVLESYRGRQIGEIVVKIIIELAREIYNCYKLSLDCKDELISFYGKNNFVHGSNMLCIRFDH